MISGVIAFIFGIFEAFMLKNLLFAATSGKYKDIAIYLVIKLVTYGIAISLIVFLFSEYLINCIIGFSIGMPAVTIVWFIYYTLKNKNVDSGDDQNENNNNN